MYSSEAEAVSAFEPEPCTVEPGPSPSRRIEYLDGLRGLAIAIVLLFHGYCRWPELYPFGAAYAGSPVDTDITGVQLFFMISGFVILMSAEATRTLTSFIYKRWIRLFPAMLACSLFVYFTASLFPERPRGAIDIFDLLPGLSLLSDKAWFMFSYFGIHPKSIEGAFWSLYIEVRFYVIFGSAYFLFGRKTALGVLAALFLAPCSSPASTLNNRTCSPKLSVGY